MASNSFGTIFKVTTFGESHGSAIGVVIDGCPAGLKIDEGEIQKALFLRAPGKNSYTSPRKEEDKAEIVSGVFEGQTTGAPICILIKNKDADPSKYEPIKDILRPGHANFSYLEKYGIFDYRGGGRASARETAARVAAGAIAYQLLKHYGISLNAYIKMIGGIEASIDFSEIEKKIHESPLFCPDKAAETKMCELIEKVKSEGDSVGGIVEFTATSVPAGLGSPIYEKLEAVLGLAMMSIPAVKGFEIGSGFESACMRGSVHNDLFENKKMTKTNHAGGILGGISTGLPIIGRVAFKPPSSIMQTQESVTTSGETALLKLPDGSRHDPCVAIRGVPVVKAMAALVLADALLSNRGSRL